MTWKDITLKQFHELALIDKVEGLPIEKAIKRLKVLGIEPDDSSLGNLISQIPDFLTELPKGDIKETYLINGKDYKPFVNFINMNPSRFLDLYTQVQGKDPQDITQWAPLLSLILSEPGQPYDYQTHINKSFDIYNFMSFEDIYPLVVFFSKVWNHLQMIVLDSSTEALTKQTQELMRSLKQNMPDLQSIGDGSPTSLK